jgi:LmbE family N-acetylglucosaminyl deacetylase
MKRLLLAYLAVCAAGGLALRAQMRVVPVDEEQGHVALGLVLRHLGNTGIFMHATAHPDDENNALLVMLNRGLGFRTALVTATRGNGGQNEIGPEIFEALGVLRTEELAAMHRFDGAEQYFTRAVDFGFSFSIEETYEKWGREEITADFVRLIRTIRPDVILGLQPDGAGGGQHHQASAVIAREASQLAGDPTKYPDQLKEGLRAWQPKKFYFSRFGPPDRATEDGRFLTTNLAAYDPLLGRTYAEIGTEARSMHKCQGMAQLLALPGPSLDAFRLVESAIPGHMGRSERSLFDGIDTSIAGLAQFAGSRPPRALTNVLGAIQTSVQSAARRFTGEGAAATLPSLLTGLRALRALRAQLGSLVVEEEGRFEIDFRLRQKEREFQQAILLANGIRVEALADDGVVVPGQPVNVSVVVANRGAADVAVRQVRFEGFEADVPCSLTEVVAGGRGRGSAAPASGAPISTLGKDQSGRCEPTLTVPKNARITEPYWHRDGEAGRYTFDDDAPFGLPYRLTPFYVQVTLAFSGAEEVIKGLPVQYRYQGNIFSGEKRSELLVVPALSVRVSPEIVILPSPPAPARAPAAPARGTAPVAGRGGRGAGAGQGIAASGRGAAARGRGAAPTPVVAPSLEREVRVAVINDTKGATAGVVRLDAPAGWMVTPPDQKVAFAREDESRTVRFQLRPAPDAAHGEYAIRASVTAAGQTFSRGYQVIEYAHIRRQHIYDAAAARLKIIDVKTAPSLRLGYVMGVGDEVPAAIEQLGVQVDLLGPEDLAWGDLSRFHTIVTGVRAYERRDDLRANNSRLLEFVRAGGTLLVQYNKFEFNDAQYGPHPARVSANRVTDEGAPVVVLDPTSPVFTTPNRITDEAWSGWVQERGLYFLGERDPRYRDLVAIEDPFPYNKGEKRGALVMASHGKGRWIYIGLGLWRELPAGVDGAYQLLANLISLGRT